MTAPEAIEQLHPYFPVGLALSGDIFIENDWSVPILIAVFAAGWGLILGATLAVVKRVNPNLKGWDQLLVLWFVLSKST